MHGEVIAGALDTSDTSVLLNGSAFRGYDLHEVSSDGGRIGHSGIVPTQCTVGGVPPQGSHCGVYLLAGDDVRGGKGRSVGFHERPIHQSSTGDWDATLQSEAIEWHEARELLYGVGNFADEVGLVVERFNDAGNVETLKVAKSSVNDSQCVV